MSKSLKTRKHPDITKMFTSYWSYLNQDRPVQAKEARQLYEYFDACFKDDIKVTYSDKYLQIGIAAVQKDDIFEDGMKIWFMNDKSVDSWVAAGS